MPGFPIRTSADRRLVDVSPRLFAVTHVLHRFSTPRHPPLALHRLEEHSRCSCSLCNSQGTNTTTTRQQHKETAPSLNSQQQSAGSTRHSLKTEDRTQSPPEPATTEPKLQCGNQPERTHQHTNWEWKQHNVTPTLLRKEVIQPHLPVRLPCYDFTPIADPTFDSSLLAVGPLASGVADFRGVTGGVYKARERIHPGDADPGLLATPASRSRVADSDPN